MRAKRWHLLGLTLAVLWLFVRGIALTPTRLVEEGIIGLALGFPTAFVFRRLYPGNADLGRLLRASPYAALYLGTFLWELLTANVGVAYRVLSPSMPIEPRVIEVPLRVETPFAVTTIANSITLTPGTLSMDYDDESNTIYVHAIQGRDRDAVVDPIRRWEDYALVIFEESKQPNDPVTQPLEQGGGSDD